MDRNEDYCILNDFIMVQGWMPIIINSFLMPNSNSTLREREREREWEKERKREEIVALNTL